MSTSRGMRELIRSRAEAFCRDRKACFSDDTELLDAASTLFDLRDAIEEESNAGKCVELQQLAKTLRHDLHEMLDRSNGLAALGELATEVTDWVEREIVLVLALDALGMRDGRCTDVDDLQRQLNLRGSDGLAVVRALHENSLLARRGIVFVEAGDLPRNNRIRLLNHLLEPMFTADYPEPDPENYEVFLDSTRRLFCCLRECEEQMGRWHGGNEFAAIEVSSSRHRAFNFDGKICRILKRHPDWPLQQWLHLNRDERWILAALLGKELDFAATGCSLFRGLGLAHAVAAKLEDVRRKIDLLRPDSRLRQQGYIQPSSGSAAGTQDDTELREMEFELTGSFLDRIKVKRKARFAGKSRVPRLTMADLVLADDVRTALAAAIAQVKHQEVILDGWGLGSVIHYGRGVSMLFSGPPGVGKTATAEAMAHALGKRLLPVRHDEIQSCWVGETEKNIARIFREAQDADVVVLWDEADSMLANRDQATRRWEVTEVNVLLQEIERFTGVCILCTNRTPALDSALARRIAVKLVFTPPDRPQRAQIWRTLLPTTLPLADDVDIERLAAEALTGGQIKNAVLGAARTAVARNPNGTVLLADFLAAIEDEQKGTWHTGNVPIGFGR